MTADLLLAPPAPVADPEPTACQSTYVGHSLAAGRLACAVIHAETGEMDHAADVAGHWFRWSDADAAAAELALSWTCLYCTTACQPHQFRGCCSTRCAYLEHDADDEMEMEAA